MTMLVGSDSFLNQNNDNIFDNFDACLEHNEMQLHGGEASNLMSKEREEEK